MDSLHEPEDRARYYAQGLWRDETFYDLLCRQADAQPEAFALRDSRRRLNWRNLHAWVNGIAADLTDRGLGAGDRASIWLGNRAEVLATFLACNRQSIACNPSLHRTHTGEEVVALLERLGARLLLTESGHGEGDAFIAGSLRPDGLDTVLTPETLAGPAAPPETQRADPDATCYLAFTSGSSGPPKCVAHSANTILANTRDMVRDWGHGPDTRMLTLSPLSHHIAWVAVGQWLNCGCELIVNDPPKGTSQFDWLLETGATYVMGVPTHAMDILAELQRRGKDRLGEVKIFYMAGAPIPAAVAEAFSAQGIVPQNVYGMTENSSHQYTHPDDNFTTITSTCGRGGQAYEVRIFDAEDADKEVPVGEHGQIAGRGAALMLGYLGDAKANRNRDGWFLSGDLGVLDDRSNLRIVGRLKDLIIRGGRNIAPAHIEDLAVRHAAVEKAAAFPIADARLGEKVCLAILGQSEPTPLLDHLAEQGLSRYDMPEYFLQMEAFPLTPSGKILKRELVAMVVRGELAPQPVRWSPSDA